MANDKISKRVHVRECKGRPRKRWIDFVHECLKLKKRGLNVWQTRRMVYDRNEMWGFARGNFWDIAMGMNPCFDEMLQL